LPVRKLCARCHEEFWKDFLEETKLASILDKRTEIVFQVENGKWLAGQRDKDKQKHNFF
jgi:hypothetical protein